MARSCPDCSVPLRKQPFHGVELDVCPQCAGIFFDEGEVREVKHAFEELDAKIVPSAALSTQEQARTRLCPACNVAMTPYRYMYASPIMLDSCERCGGIWVENGELQQMADFARTERTNESKEAVVAQMQVQSERNIHRAKIAERSLRLLARRVYTGKL